MCLNLPAEFSDHLLRRLGEQLRTAEGSEALQNRRRQHAENDRCQELYLPVQDNVVHKIFMEAGKTNPETRLTAISTKPSASSPRLGLISAQTSGRFFHALFLRFSLLAGVGDAIAVAMILG